MPRLLGIHIQNFKSLKNIELGKSNFTSNQPELEKLSLVIGKNGVGKSSLLDAMGFLADCLKEGIQSACDKPHRGGFDRLLTSSSEDKSISFRIYYKQDDDARPITYDLKIESRDSVPFVGSESLKQRKKGQTKGQPFPFLKLTKGKGKVWAGKKDVDGSAETNEKMDVKLEDLDRLGISTLGTLKEHPRISALREFISDWYLSYFYPDAARTLPSAGPQRHLDRQGYNIGNVVHYLKTKYPKELKKVIAEISARIPGVISVNIQESQDKRILLQFSEKGYQDPFFQAQMSDGTLKLFTYLLLLYSPEQRSFIGIEEPENGLYHGLHDGLARYFIEYVNKPNSKSQIFIVTHSTYMADAMQPEQVWVLSKDTSGFTKAIRAADIPYVSKMVSNGIPLGSVWFSNHLEAQDS